MNNYLSTETYFPGKPCLAKWNPNSRHFKEAIVLGIVQQRPEKTPDLILRFKGYSDFKTIPYIPERVQNVEVPPSESEIQININKLVLMILNKVSGTKTETLEKQLYNNQTKFHFLEILTQSNNPKICLKISQVILQKSQLEPGFNDLYTNLVVYLSSKNNIFKTVFQEFMNSLLEKEDFIISNYDKQEYFSFLQFSGKLYLGRVIPESSINQQLITLFEKKIPQNEIYIEAVLKLMEIITQNYPKLTNKELFLNVYTSIQNFSCIEVFPVSNRIKFLCLNYLERNKINIKSIKIKKKKN